MIGLLANILAGLGFVFIGLRFISDNLQQASGRNMRRVIGRATGTALRGSLAGAAAGALMQSSNAVTLIAGNLVQARLLNPVQALPVVAGANIGTALIVFVAAIDLRLFVFYLIGIVGLSFHFNLGRSPAFRHLLGAALGAAMLFLGLDIIKTLPDAAGALGFDLGMIAAGELPPLLGLLFGLGASFLTQSSSTPTIIAVAAIGSGLLSFDDCLPLVLGANLGSGLSTLLGGRSLAGSARQLCYGHIAVKLVGTLAIGLAALLVDTDALAAQTRPETALALAFLAMQVAGTAVVIGFRRPLSSLTERLAPPSALQNHATPAFIYDGALDEPSTALDLAAREFARLVGELPDRLPDLDLSAEARRTAAAAGRARSEGARAVAHELEAFLAALIDRGVTGTDLSAALRLQVQLGDLRALQDALDELGAIVGGYAAPPALAFNLSESLRTILLSLAEFAAPAGATPEDAELLLTLTNDRGDLLERIRTSLLSETAAPTETQRDLFLATGLFERALWIVRRLTQARAEEIAAASAA